MIKFFLHIYYKIKNYQQSKKSNIIVYERDMKNLDDKQIIVFQNSDDVEVFKLEQEIKELNAELAEINARLKPMEEEMRRRHRKLWNY